MAQGVLMPKAGITVEECVISEWLKHVGDKVEVGDILFTYETDKAEFECESTAAGTLLEIFYEDGDEVPVLVNVCAIGEPGESTEGLRSEGQEAPAAAPAEADAPADVAAPSAPAAAPAAAAPAATSPAGSTKISPRARMTAGTLGVEAAAASPTGPNGRIIERDVRALAASGALSPASNAAAPAAAAATTASKGGEIDFMECENIKFSPVRKATAKAMVTSLSTMAQLTHYHTFDATSIMNLRKKIKAGGEAAGLPNVSLNDMVMYAISRVLLRHPDLNSTIEEENVLRRFKHVNLGMAVNSDKGLKVPTIFGADTKSLAEISADAKALAGKVKDGSITMDELSGGTFSVSNLGTTGVEMFTAVINPPQVGIVAVCGVTTRVRETEHGLETYPCMGLCLTYDHRAVDGFPASTFMQDLCNSLENFELLLMK